MSVARIEQLDDPRLDPFRDVRRRTPPHGRFVAESWLVVERLLASDFECESVVVSDRRFTTLGDRLPENVSVLRLTDDLADALVGFDFHNGVMACGVRRPVESVRDPRCLRAVEDSSLVVAVPRVTDPTNLAGLIRTSRALGASALLLGPHCPDPFSRRVLRGSAGNAFFLPVVEAEDLALELGWLRQRGFELVGSTLDPFAVPLPEATGPERTVLLLGHEYDGLGPDWLDRCDQRVTIPMFDDTDSLNVVTSAAILLYHFSVVGCRGTRPQETDQ